MELDAKDSGQELKEFELPFQKEEFSEDVVKNDDGPNLYVPGQSDQHFIFPELKQQLDLKFDNLTYAVDVPVKGKKFWQRSTMKKKLLDNVSGAVAPGEFMILMGPSGAGKTTLLNVLAGRVLGGVEGHIWVNGEPRNKLFKRNTAFVLQEDIFFSELTVQDTLLTTGRLVLPKESPDKEKIQRVDELIDNFRLRKCANGKVGSPLKRGLSGGEKKRLNIANELLFNSPLVLMDEPTSGLDASTALMVVTVLSDLAKSGRTVIATLHQPSSQMFDKFDKLLIIADGRVAFHGPPSSLVPYFSSLGFYCPAHYNPLDYVMELVDDHPDHEEPKAMKKAITDAYSYEEVAQYDPEYQKKIDSKQLPPPLQPKTKYQANWFQQYWQLFKRGFKQHIPVAFSNLIIFMMICAIASIVWWQRGYEQTDIADRTSLTFFVMLHWFVFPMFGIINTFVTEKLVFKKERASAMYRVSAYFFGRLTAELPLDLITPLVFCSILYWCANLNNHFKAFAIFCFLSYLAYIIGASFGLVLAAWFEKLEIATTISAVLFFLAMLLSGFFANPDKIPDWFSWLKYIVPLKYLLDASDINEFTDSPKKFKLDSGIKVTGEDLLAQKDIILESIWTNVAVIIGFIVLLHFLAYLSLYYNTKIRSPWKDKAKRAFSRERAATYAERHTTLSHVRNNNN